MESGALAARSLAPRGSSAPTVPFRRALAVLRPPLRDGRFWAIQALVFVASGTHDAMEALGLVSRIGDLYFVVVAVLMVLPVVLAAVNFGRSGALATGLWALVISSPNLGYWHSGVDRYGELVQLVLVDALAVLLGYWVDAERRARRRAESTGIALSASEAKYRGLFETAAEPVLVVDGSGCIREANAAAYSLFGVEPGAPAGLLAEAGAAPVLESLGAAHSGSIRTGPEIGLQARDGRRVWVEPVAAPSGDDANGMLQVILRDVTSQRRRRRGLETYAARVLRAQEDERRRIAQELHDGTLHDMVLLCRQLEVAAETCAELSSESAVAALEGARTGIQVVADGLRNLARGLRPSVLDDLGLAPATRALVGQVDSGLVAAFSVRGAPRRLTADAELALFRIAQEAVRNAVQHSGGQRVDVELSFAQQEVTLSVRDDGKGFRVPASLDEGVAQRRLGLLGMRERARLAGAEFRLESGPGRGTIVQVRLAV